MPRTFALSFICVLCIFLLAAPSGIAQDETVTPTTGTAEPEEDIFKTKDIWGVGLYAGVLSGGGLAFRYHPIGRIGIQLSGGAIKLDDLMYDFGGEVQFDFDSQGRSRFYGYLGAGYYYVEKTTKDEVTQQETTKNKLDAPLRLGLGIAYEWGVSDKLIFNLNGAFTYFTDGQVLPLPQLGLIYYFK